MGDFIAPELSINVTVHNKGFLIYDVLQAIKNTVSPPPGNYGYEIVIVLDGCSDNSEERVQLFKQNNPQIPIRILYANNVYESAANNMAFAASVGTYVAIIQDDIVMQEPAWDKRILTPFKKWDDVFSVSGRMAHNWRPHPMAMDLAESPLSEKDWCDILIACDQSASGGRIAPATAMSTFFIRDTCNRGPLVLRRDLANKMRIRDYAGPFNESFVQDCDDHDLHYRMYKELQTPNGGHYVCGAVPVGFVSEPGWGGTRTKEGATKPWAIKLQNINSRRLYAEHRDAMRCVVENRII